MYFLLFFMAASFLDLFDLILIKVLDTIKSGYEKNKTLLEEAEIIADNLDLCDIIIHQEGYQRLMDSVRGFA